jgi:hypothetical protein
MFGFFWQIGVLAKKKKIKNGLTEIEIFQQPDIG